MSNYRRLWMIEPGQHTTRMEDVCSYFPAPFVTLRTLKGEIMVGLKPGQAEELKAEDPNVVNQWEKRRNPVGYSLKIQLRCC